MAKLQGYFVQHGNSFASALENIISLETDELETSAAIEVPHHSVSVEQSTAVNKKRPQMSRRTLTVQEIDKMVFNPQEGWDKDIIDLSKSR
jgi:hypothetical protein